MKQKRTFAALLAMISLCTALTGCAFRPQSVVRQADTEHEPGSSQIIVGYSQIGSESAWRTANTQSFQETFSPENGYFFLFDNARQKQENQIKAIRSFISQQVDYIVFSPVTEDGWDTVLGEAKDAGIPVIVSDRSVDVEDESLYTAWVGGDMTAEGVRAGKWLEQDLEKSGRADADINLVVLQGTARSSAQVGRSKGFEEVANKHPNWHILARQDAEFTTARGKEVMAHYLKSFDRIDVLVSQNDDMTFGAMEAMDEAGVTYGKDGQVTVISFDSVKKALEMVQNGKINADIECSPLLGPYVDRLIKKLEKGEIVPRSNPVDEKVFTQENVARYLPDRRY